MRSTGTIGPTPADSFRAVLSLWPDLAKLAADVRRPYFTVTGWKHRDTVPVHSWASLVASAQMRGIQDVTLLRLAMIVAAQYPAPEMQPPAQPEPPARKARKAKPAHADAVHNSLSS